MAYKKYFLVLIVFFSCFFTQIYARRPVDSALRPIIMEEKNQQLCEGPLAINCPRDGKIFGDITWSPFSDESPKNVAPPPPEDPEAVSAQVEGVEYADSHPLET